FPFVRIASCVDRAPGARWAVARAGEPEVRRGERAGCEDARVELLDVRERSDVDSASEGSLERLPPAALHTMNERFEPSAVHSRDDGNHGVRSRIGHGFRPTV